MNSLYAQYIKEREDFEIIEDDKGFATYKIFGDECYIRDIYVKPEFRKLDIASKYADKISEIAKEQGSKYLSGTVDARLESATTSIKVLLGYGFKLLKTTEEKMIFIKEL